MKKTTLVLSLIAVIILGLPTSLSAESIETQYAGIYKFGKVGIDTLKTVSASGGTWTHEVTYSTVYSNYYHSSRTHKSTACNSHSCDYSGWINKGKTSLAHTNASMAGNKAYYDVK